MICLWPQAINDNIFPPIKKLFWIICRRERVGWSTASRNGDNLLFSAKLRSLDWSEWFNYRLDWSWSRYSRIKIFTRKTNITVCFDNSAVWIVFHDFQVAMHASVELRTKVRRIFKHEISTPPLKIEKFHAFRATQHFNLNNDVQLSSSDTKPQWERDEKKCSDKKQQR